MWIARDCLDAQSSHNTDPDREAELHSLTELLVTQVDLICTPRRKATSLRSFKLVANAYARLWRG
jgi:hypothetical protein